MHSPDDESTGDERYSDESSVNDFLSEDELIPDATSNSEPLPASLDFSRLSIHSGRDSGLEDDVEGGDSSMWVDEETITVLDPSDWDAASVSHNNIDPTTAPHEGLLGGLSSRPVPWKTADETFQPTPQVRKRRQNPFLARTAALQELLAKEGDISERVLATLHYMKQQNLDLPLLLEALCWGTKDLTSHPEARHARTTLMVSKQLPTIIARMHRPPRSHRRGTRTQAARRVFEGWALDTVQRAVNREMRALDQLFRDDASEISEEKLLAVDWPQLMQEVRTSSPTLWSLLRSASVTPLQEKRNTLKNPDSSILMMIAMASFSRSQKRSKIQQLNTVYFKACGLSAKAFDTLSAFGITMSQKWVYRALDTLSDAALTQLGIDIKQFMWFASHDNLNLSFKTYEQRLDRNTHFDSGTAATVFIVKDLPANSFDKPALLRQIVEGCRNPIRYHDILELEKNAATVLEEHNVYTVLSFLLESPAFDFKTYAYKDDNRLEAPHPINPLPTGPDHTTTQYMLKTMHINQQTYEGNEQVIDNIFRQLGLDSPSAQVQVGEEFVIIWTSA